MTHSPLATISVPAHTNNYTKGRKKIIRCVTIHHVAGVATAQAIGNIFANPNRKGSSNYGIGNDGTIGVFVEEENTPWTNSNFDSNSESITIETSNSATGGDWPVSDAAYNALIRLVADIAKRNNLGKLVVGQNLTKHSDFTATACPGPYLTARMQDIANKANDINYPPEPSIVWSDCMADVVAPNGTRLINIVTGKMVKEYAPGTRMQFAQVGSITGMKYYRTEYSKTHNVNNGCDVNDFIPYEPEPEPQPEPAPEPEKPAEEPTAPKETNVFLAIIKAIIEFIKQVLTRKK